MPVLAEQRKQAGATPLKQEGHLDRLGGFKGNDSGCGIRGFICLVELKFNAIYGSTKCKKIAKNFLVHLRRQIRYLRSKQTQNSKARNQTTVYRHADTQIGSD